MRFLYVITRSDTIGGAQNHVMELASALREQGHVCRVVCGFGDVFPKRLRERGIDFQHVPSLRRPVHPIRDLVALRDLTRAIRDFKPDLVSTHSTKAGALGRLAAWRCGVPALFTAHGWAFTDGIPAARRVVYREAERMLLPLCQRVICVSEADRQLALTAGFDPERLVTVHNARHDVPQRAKHREKSPVQLIMIGRLDRQKDHRTLFEALADLENFELVLLGDGPFLPSLQELADQLGISSRVRFLGLRHDVPELLARADVFVLCSNWEGFPRSTIEAMRAGLPVVVSDVGGAAEAVREGVNGYSVARGDVGALRMRLRELVGSAALRGRMGRESRTRYEQEFTFDKMLDATCGVYSQVLGRPLGVLEDPLVKGS